MMEMQLPDDPPITPGAAARVPSTCGRATDVAVKKKDATELPPFSDRDKAASQREKLVRRSAKGPHGALELPPHSDRDKSSSKSEGLVRRLAQGEPGAPELPPFSDRDKAASRREELVRRLAQGCSDSTDEQHSRSGRANCVATETEDAPALPHLSDRDKAASRREELERRLAQREPVALQSHPAADTKISASPPPPPPFACQKLQECEAKLGERVVFYRAGYGWQTGTVAGAEGGLSSHVISDQAGYGVPIASLVEVYRPNVADDDIARLLTHDPDLTVEDARSLLSRTPAIDQSGPIPWSRRHTLLRQHLDRRRHSRIEKSWSCAICMEDGVAEGLVPVDCSNCGTSVCASCYAGYLCSKIDAGEVNPGRLVCPAAACSRQILPREVEMVLRSSGVAASVLEKYARLRKTIELESNPFARWCPQPGCNTATVGKSGQRKLICSNAECAAAMCFRCGEEWHTGRCRTTRENKEFARWVSKTGAKRCPQCRYHVEKNGGCNHITCQRCGYNWCWLCGGKYTHDHFSGPFGCHANRNFSLWGPNKAVRIATKTAAATIAVPLGIAGAAAAAIPVGAYALAKVVKKQRRQRKLRGRAITRW